jgi:hypothetical protein
VLTPAEREWLSAQRAVLERSAEGTNLPPRERAIVVLACLAAYEVLTGESRGPVAPSDHGTRVQSSTAKAIDFTAGRVNDVYAQQPYPYPPGDAP